MDQAVTGFRMPDSTEDAASEWSVNVGGSYL